MRTPLFNSSILLTFLLLSAVGLSAQVDVRPTLFPDFDGRRPEESEKIKEMISKQQTERDKKEHTELLKRGEEALQLSDQLESSFESHRSLTPADMRKLESLEKLVTKIRNGLGGDDDVGENAAESALKPSTINDAFRYLQTATVQLVDELKKTTRFSISVVAIQSSNTVIRLARLLRIRK